MRSRIAYLVYFLFFIFVAIYFYREASFDHKVMIDGNLITVEIAEQPVLGRECFCMSSMMIKFIL
ncbi:MAG: hypothetical protein IPL31_12755 [Saprospiraceae bacterium]|nr:hypothetical protein [Saprospiraceae bacterium]